MAPGAQQAPTRAAAGKRCSQLRGAAQGDTTQQGRPLGSWASATSRLEPQGLHTVAEPGSQPRDLETGQAPPRGSPAPGLGLRDLPHLQPHPHCSLRPGGVLPSLAGPGFPREARGLRLDEVPPGAPCAPLTLAPGSQLGKAGSGFWRPSTRGGESCTRPTAAPASPRGLDSPNEQRNKRSYLWGSRPDGVENPVNRALRSEEGATHGAAGPPGATGTEASGRRGRRCSGGWGRAGGPGGSRAQQGWARGGHPAGARGGGAELNQRPCGVCGGGEGRARSLL